MRSYFPDPDYDFEPAASLPVAPIETFLPSAASPDASQEISPHKNTCLLPSAGAQEPVTGDAGNHKESHS